MVLVVVVVLVFFTASRPRTRTTTSTIEAWKHRKRSTNYTVERGAGFGRLVPGGPSGGRKFSDSIDRKIG